MKMIRIINKLKSKKGFTLIELIVVLAVLAIIMAIAIPRFTGVQDSAKKKTDASTILTIARAAELYYASEDTTADITADDLVPKYIDAIDFQTSAYGADNGGDLNITFDANSGDVKIVKGTGTSAEEAYPVNNLD
jgi:type IV pilus assembly protein PilA